MKSSFQLSPCNFWVVLTLFVWALLLKIAFSSAQQLSPPERRILLQVQDLLEYPQVLQEWNKWTNFCSVQQTPSLVITCSGNHITELTIVGNTTSPHPPLSQKFSIDSFFTLLTKLSSLKRLSLINLGLTGTLPAKVSRFVGLEVLNISSNPIHGSIPQSIVKFKKLKSLVLRDNFFNGSVPDLKGFSVLEELDLSGNSLGPGFPSLGSNLVKVVLSNNSLRSAVPEEMEKMKSMEILDLYANNLVGSIPSFLFSLPSLKYINLGRNQFSGELHGSVSCSKSLNFVDISNNLLVGKLPVCLQGSSNSGNRTIISLWNCLGNTTSSRFYQHAHSFCAEKAIAVNPNSRGEEHHESSTIKLGIVLGVIGGIVAVFSAIGFLILATYRTVSRKRDQEKSGSFTFNTNPSSHFDGGNSRRPARMVSIGLPPYNVFTQEEMEDATNHFDPSNLVGEGSQGQQVYRGKLKDGTGVLVNCQKLMQQKHSTQVLQQHMDAISKLRHRHLISVLGHSLVTSQEHPPTASTTLFIVLENIAGASSLKDQLTDWRKRDVLKWPERMGMAIGITKGIQYLHAGRVTGNDLKLENVLLDDTLTARLCNFNISLPSKILSESSRNAHDRDRTSSKNAEQDDIYQLGVILIELIIGRPITSQAEVKDLKLQIEICLAESPGKLRNLTDPCIRSTFAYESLKTTVQIALNCLNQEPSRRPSIEDVLWHLQYSIQVQEGWGNSGNLSGKISGNLSGHVGTKL
ncbi:unnamed protein product [Cuscuta europaea]|uniref:Protein kinase domain-containing protein n=1 Tax=Cuscuta europaea TaxID=41803 RepID=A0A9P1ELA4_CUSEU|nr:unnamed protein product [Cuscuta europaea]